MRMSTVVFIIQNQKKEISLGPVTIIVHLTLMTLTRSMVHIMSIPMVITLT